MGKILVLDFGSQVSQLIARQVRGLKVYCEIHPFDWPLDKIKTFNPKGIILSGGPESVYNQHYQADSQILQLGVPVLGICYGMQWMAESLGGKVVPSPEREFGFAKVVKTLSSPFTEGLSDYPDEQALKVWMSHGDRIESMPEGFKVVGKTEYCPYAIIENADKLFYGVQFHPEVTHTVSGIALMKRFVLGICAIKPTWTMPNYIDEAIQTIKNQVGDEEVILALSGGVDSSVAAALVRRAIGNQLSCVFVDHGLLRFNEGIQVKEMLSSLGVKIIYRNAVDYFLTRLKGISDPEQKRKVIGAAFIDVFQEEAAKRPYVKWLAQGTIYPDVIESAGGDSKKAHVIKSHHNVGGLPDTLHLKLLEPLRSLFKDEVRQLGLELGLSPEMVSRHPFPGPGLAVRILGEIKPEYLDLLRKVDVIFLDALRQEKDSEGISWYNKVSQAFAVFLPIKSVGVMGDTRSYEYVVALRSVETTDFMTAHWSQLPYSLLGQIADRIINEVAGVNRVVYDISGKPPATIEWE